MRSDNSMRLRRRPAGRHSVLLAVMLLLGVIGALPDAARANGASGTIEPATSEGPLFPGIMLLDLGFTATATVASSVVITITGPDGEEACGDLFLEGCPLDGSPVANRFPLTGTEELGYSVEFEPGFARIAWTAALGDWTVKYDVCADPDDCGSPLATQTLTFPVEEYLNAYILPGLQAEDLLADAYVRLGARDTVQIDRERGSSVDIGFLALRDPGVGDLALDSVAITGPTEGLTCTDLFASVDDECPVEYQIADVLSLGSVDVEGLGFTTFSLRNDDGPFDIEIAGDAAVGLWSLTFDFTTTTSGGGGGELDGFEFVVELTVVPAPEVAPEVATSAIVSGPAGAVPAVTPGAAQFRDAGGNFTPAELTVIGGTARIAAGGLTAGIAGDRGATSVSGPTASQRGSLAVDLDGPIPAGSVVEVWAASTPRLVAAARSDGSGSLQIVVPVDDPLDGAGPLPVGAHTLQLQVPMDGGLVVMNVGFTVVGPVPSSIPAGEGPTSDAPWLLILGVGWLVAAGATARRSGRALSA